MMHRIAKDTDLSPLAGKMVEQVCIGRHQVIVRLEDELCISIEGDFQFGSAASGEREMDYRHAAQKFADLLERRILKAEVIQNDVVVVEFSDGARLTIFDSSDQYKSFQIKLPDRLVVV
jgi:hypothetical protein